MSLWFADVLFNNNANTADFGIRVLLGGCNNSIVVYVALPERSSNSSILLDAKALSECWRRKFFRSSLSLGGWRAQWPAIKSYCIFPGILTQNIALFVVVVYGKNVRTKY